MRCANKEGHARHAGADRGTGIDRNAQDDVDFKLVAAHLALRAGVDEGRFEHHVTRIAPGSLLEAGEALGVLNRERRRAVGRCLLLLGRTAAAGQCQGNEREGSDFSDGHADI